MAPLVVDCADADGVSRVTRGCRAAHRCVGVSTWKRRPCCGKGLGYLRVMRSPGTSALLGLGRRHLVVGAVVVLLVATQGALVGAVRARNVASASVVAADVRASLSITTLPTMLTPSVANAPNDTALVDTPSLSNCNVAGVGFVVSKCAFGDTSSKRTMFLWGDSHAFMWFPALNAVAKTAHWKLVALMKPGCPPADLTVWNTLTHTSYASCNTFRTKVIAAINKLKPQLVVVTESFTSYAGSGHGAPNTITLGQWRSALEKTLKLVHAQKKAVLGSTVLDGPLSPVQCLAANPTAVQNCTVSDTSQQKAQRSTEAAAARAEKAAYVNTLPWLCSTAVTPEACSPVIGDPTNGYMIAYYAAGHLTETYDLFLQGVLGTALKPSMK